MPYSVSASGEQCRKQHTFRRIVIGNVHAAVECDAETAALLLLILVTVDLGCVSVRENQAMPDTFRQTR
jgi:hypothetical protein